MHGYRGLVVLGGRKGLRRLGRNRGVLFDQLGHHATQGFDTQRQRGNVEQQYVLDIAAEHTALDRGAAGDGFVGVDVSTRFAAEEVLDHFLYFRHASLAADQDDIVDIRNRYVGVVHRDLERVDGARDQVVDQRLELGAGNFQIKMLRPRGVCGDIRQVDIGLLARR